MTLILEGHKSVDTNKITEMTGLRPTFHSKHRDADPNPSHSEWFHDLFPDPADSVDERIGLLLKRLGRHRKRIVNTARELNLKTTFQVRINRGENEPDYSIRAVTLKRIMEYHADLDLVFGW